jgi:hypothetical protein
MKYPVFAAFLLTFILFSSSVSALWENASESTRAVCGNNAVEFGEECDPAGKRCYTRDFIEGRCTSSCTCTVFAGIFCGDRIVDTGEDCELDRDCPMFNYCSTSCKCVPKVVSANTSNVPKNITKSFVYAPEENRTEGNDEENETEIIDTVVNESFFEAEDFTSSPGIKITAAITHATEKIFGSLFGLIKRWFA